MQLERVVVMIGRASVTLGDLMWGGAVLSLLLLCATVIFAWRAQRLRSSDAIEAMRRTSDIEYRLAEMAGALRQFAEQSQGAQAYLASALEERLEQVTHRLGRGLSDQTERTSETLTQLYERLAIIDTAQKNLTALSSEMVTLKDILANKQARGAYGEGRMEAIIRDGLPASAYAFQPTLSNGMRPDCLIKLPDSELRLVIDAKFPLEAFSGLRNVRSEAESRTMEARLRSDVLKHVKDISEKYLIPGETHETAIMFVPAESVYADIHERFEDVVQKAHRARVILASPNILMLLSQTMQAIFKDHRMREQAGLIKGEVVRLLEDMARLKERIGDLQRHFGAASSDLEKLNVSADKVSKRALKIESLELEEDAPAAAPLRVASSN
jgi:DNA recombination protein RmuC